MGANSKICKFWWKLQNIAHWTIWHHLKFCDIWHWWTSNFSNFWRAGTLKVNTFQQKQKLFLKIGTCKTLEIICKTQRNILGVCNIRPKLGVFSIYSKYIFFLLHYSACKKATALVFIWQNRGHPAVRF